MNAIEGQGGRPEICTTRDYFEPARESIFALMRRDIERHVKMDGRDGGLSARLRVLADAPGLQAVLIHRLGAWMTRLAPWPLQFPVKIVHFFLHKLCIICWGIHIDNHARIGGGLHIVHFGGIVIGAVRMGSDCSIMQNVTVGRRAGGEGVPVLGDRVSIATGSVVYGDIQIGDGVSIGPLTVVSRSLPPRVLVMGNPMRVIKRDYDNSIEIYGVPADVQLNGEGETQSEQESR
ncbi:MAG: hypothetical protein A2075_04070 [Geobacteraceae bacterium GWC2_58_44]|nr:MAG: hypothetical protein A2075_04070 [Geobacteraceae bacterium GWC2_58_44]